jgi:ADP-ribose pyrophosphatase YjhB (NUDIX family)
MIRVRVICVFRRGDTILVSFARDPRNGRRYARTIGGGVEVGERTEDALRREIREELAAEIERPHLLGVLENIFTIEGRQVHEIVFVYDAQFADASLAHCEEIAVNEAACIGPATWVAISEFGDDTLPLYPRDLVLLLRT